MKYHDIKKAEDARSRYEDRKQQKTDLLNIHVTSVSLGHTPDTDGDIILRRRNNHGRLASSIGFPEELAKKMKDALVEWLDHKMKEARDELTALGVELDETEQEYRE